jgi:protein-disulfide isomerase
LKNPVYESGQKNARVTLVEFTDYQCPFCQRAFQQTWPTIKKDYIDSGKIHFIIRDMPLPFHNNAKLAATAARCAGEQNKYLEMHDQLFTNQSVWQ